MDTRERHTEIEIERASNPRHLAVELVGTN